MNMSNSVDDSYNKEGSSIKKGMYIVLNERPCKTVEINICVPGKHGHSKVRIVGIDIFNGKKYETSLPGSGSIQVPIIIKKDHQLMDISDDNYLSIMCENGILREDFKLPDGELGTKIKNLFEKDKNIIIQTTHALEFEQITGFNLSQEK